MARITVEDCLTRENNRFALVVLASRRAKQLLSGAKSLLPEVKNREVVTALREIAEGGVRFMTPEELQKVKEAESRQYMERAEQQAATSEAVAAANELFFSDSKEASDLEAELKSLELDDDEGDESFDEEDGDGKEGGEEDF